jgi:proteasome accessory factor C
MNEKRATTGDRLQRLLALIPWVAAQDGPTVEDVCSRFGIKAEALVEDLELASLIGTYPYSPDELVDVVVDDGRVWVYYAAAFKRPLRLSPEQGLALVAAGAGLLSVPGAEADGPLARAIAKLAGALGIAPEDAMAIDLATPAGGTLDLFREAIAGRRQVEIDYYSYGRDERTTRVVEPLRLTNEQGQWYLLAFCHRAGGERLFRVDRIHAAVALEATFAARTPTAIDLYRAEPDDPRVVLEIGADEGWVRSEYPVERIEDLPDGGWRITLPVSARPWLERLLLRLGPHGRVLAGDGAVPADVAATAAQRVLARYRGRGAGRVSSPEP